MNLEVLQVAWLDAAKALRAVREAVFITEQGIARSEEWDGLDDDAEHFLARLDGVPIGTARLLPSGQIGRMAVLAQHRRLGIGRQLLDAAMTRAAQRGFNSVFLHAQLTAVPLYAAAGFVPHGTVFQEAGIDHVEMTCPLALPYTPVELPEDAKRLGRSPPAAPRNGQQVQGLYAVLQAVQTTASTARRILRVRSPSLEAAVFDRPELEAVVSALARRHAQCQVRLLVTDPAPLIGVGHRLVALSRRLTSAVQLRAPRQLPADPADLQPTLVIADEAAYFHLPHTGSAQGYVDLAGAGGARAHAVDFDAAWERAVTPVELRELRL